MNQNNFVEEIEKLGIKVTEEKLEKLEKYYNLLIEYNKVMNLTSITEKEEVYLKHFYDSLTIVKVVNLKEKETLCDVGTGAGFPGIVLKILFPHLKMTLIDSLQKRIHYLNEIIKELDLKEIESIHSRGEDYQGTFDVVTSRAVANIEKLVDYTMHLVGENGIFVAMKGDIDQELTPKVEQKLMKKYKILKNEKFLLPKENSKRSLLVIQKM